MEVIEIEHEENYKSLNSNGIDINLVEEPVVSIDTIDKKTNRRNTRINNNYAAKKTVAQGMMDVALITANANQLRYLIEYQSHGSTFYIVMVLIIISLLLQVKHYQAKLFIMPYE